MIHGMVIVSKEGLFAGPKEGEAIVARSEW